MNKTQPKTLTINGSTVEAAPEETLLTIARRCGIAIPTLCDHKAVLPYGVCRLCVVEVKWGEGSKLVASCVYQPSAGDVVETESPRVRATRRMILELLLARCPSVGRLQRLAVEYGAQTGRFAPTEDAAQLERCILCGLCVRVCKEVIGRCAIGYANRGGQRTISSPFGTTSERCIGCKACVHVCPADALHAEDVDGKRIMNELHTALDLMACRECGTFFAPAKQLMWLEGRTVISVKTLETCPSCRRKNAARDVATVAETSCIK